jgi:hypothetical protein
LQFPNAVYTFALGRFHLVAARSMASLPPILVAVDEPSPASDVEHPEQLFFIHGWPDDASLWDGQVAHFSRRGYRCLRLTMPHFGGRDDAGTNGDLGGPVGFFPDCDWAALCPRLAGAVREHCGGRPVTLVIHDWGSVWGFYLQQYAPELVKAVRAPAASRLLLLERPMRLDRRSLCVLWRVLCRVLTILGGMLVGGSYGRGALAAHWRCIQCPENDFYRASLPVLVGGSAHYRKVVDFRNRQGCRRLDDAGICTLCEEEPGGQGERL